MGAGSLGIMAFVHRNAERPFGEQTGYIGSLLKAAKDVGLDACAFGPEDVDLKRKRVVAYVPGVKGWRRVRRRMPLLVYDRFFLHKPRPGVLRRYRQLLRAGAFRFLNPTLPDKWRVHRDLVRDRSVRRWLPPTRKYGDSTQLLRLARRWKEVVAKPVYGMKGRGLWFIKYDGDRLSVRRGTRGRIVMDTAQFRGWAATNLTRGYVIQRALHLRDRSGRPFDIRVLVQRDQQGELLVTGAGVRLGRRGALVSNLHQGGRALTIESALVSLPEMTPTTAAGNEGAADAFKSYLGTAALRVAQSLDRGYGPLAEVGLDFGFDLRSRRLYFIEANSRPGRIIFRRMGDHVTREVSIRRPLEYARYRLRSLSKLRC